MRRTFVALAMVTLVVANACSGETSAGTAAEPSGSAVPSASPSASASLSPRPSALPPVDPEGELCLRVGEMKARMAAFRAIELTRVNRTTLDVELDKLQAAHIELERADLGTREDELEDSLTRLGYRMGELKLAVEDFQTNPRFRRAVPNVDDDSQKVADELDAFVILSRC